MNDSIKSAIVIIGNELLSGKTLDTNTQFIAKELANLGISLVEVRIIRDDRRSIVSTIRELHPIVNFIFTTGGIGPTHDDITTESIAEAFNRKYLKNEQAAKTLIETYGQENANEAIMKMSYLPEGATLINDKTGKLLGFSIENVFVMAGTPKIMRITFEEIKSLLPKNHPISSKIQDIFIEESFIAAEMAQIQNMYDEVEIGSYPFEIEGKHATSVVARSANEEKLSECYKCILELASKYNGVV